MDTRRILIAAAAGPLLSGCAMLRPGDDAVVAQPVSAAAAAVIPAAMVAGPPADPPLASGPGPGGPGAETGRPYLAELSRRPAAETGGPGTTSGRTAIAAANREASAPSRSDRFVGGVQVFAWSPGRVYQIWAAPLRVTTLTLGAGETILSKAAGDTVRWQIGDTTSGAGPGQRSHVLLKPLERGLETNLVLTTNRRVYLLELRSGAADGFNTAVAWDEEAVADEPVAHTGTAGANAPLLRVADPVAMPEGAIEARYRIAPQGRRPRWTPTSVFNDGRRTFITFDADLQIDEAPTLFVIAPDGESQMVNYRQAGGLFVVDRVFDLAELRLGGRRPQVVRLQRLGAPQ